MKAHNTSLIEKINGSFLEIVQLRVEAAQFANRFVSALKVSLPVFISPCFCVEACA